ncbi:unnamed protein product [Boreogadus saida]
MLCTPGEGAGGRWRCKPLTTVPISQGEEVDLLGPLLGGHRDSEQSTNLSEYFPLREGPGRPGPSGLGRWSSDWPEPEQGPQAPLASEEAMLRLWGLSSQSPVFSASLTCWRASVTMVSGR